MNLPEQMANKFDRRSQMIKLIEELGECLSAVARVLNMSKGNKLVNINEYIKIEENMIDEIIDVEFLFAQMRCYFDGFEAAKERNDAEIKDRFFK